MTPLEEFQAQHGEEFARIIGSPAFRAGMIHLSIGATQEIRRLSDDQITRDSVSILAGLRGRLQYEADLLSLAVPPEPTGRQELHEDYPDAVNELFEEQKRNRPAPTP